MTSVYGNERENKLMEVFKSYLYKNVPETFCCGG